MLKSPEDILADRMAHNEHTPSDVLHRLSDHRSMMVRVGVASNPNTAAATLHSMFKDERNHTPHTMECGLENPNIDKRVIHTMAVNVDNVKDKYWARHIARIILIHPKVGVHTVKALAKHNDSGIRGKAKELLRVRGQHG